MDHFIVKGQALFTHSIILSLLSLDVVWSWTTSKDELTLIDPHQLPHCPCVVCHCCFDLWRFDFDLMIFFFFFFWTLPLMLTHDAILRFVHNVISFFKGSATRLHLVSCVVSVTRSVAYK